MIRIHIPDSWYAEREYAIKVVLQDFLGILVEIEVNEKFKDYSIILENGKSIIFEDHFSSKYDEPHGYLKESVIPDTCSFVKNEFTVEKDIPLIFGSAKLDVTESKISCGIDIFASVFFCLTRWEERVIKIRDKHNRFPVTYSLAYRNKFLHRPVVNEYVEMLWNMLVFLGFSGKRREKTFSIVPTHDIDRITYHTSFYITIKNTIKDIIRLKFKKAFLYFLSYFLILFKIKNDPFDAFDWMMDLSEKSGFTSVFFIMAGGTSKYDRRYSLREKKVQLLIDKIKKRGHKLALHYSYSTYKNPEQLLIECSEYKEVLSESAKLGRNHYLKFSVPETWQNLEESGIENDSTCGYHDKEGFRCGTGDIYSVFNILSRSRLKLKEMPMIFMDRIYPWKHKDSSIEKLEESITQLITTSKKYKMPMTTLFHNGVYYNDSIDFKRINEYIFEKAKTL